MLTVETRNMSDGRIECLASPNRKIDSVAIQHWQHTRQAEVDRVDFAIRLGIAGIIVCWTKEFCVRRQLDVAFDADRHFIFLQNIVRNCHNYIAPKSFNPCLYAANARKAISRESRTLVSCASLLRTL